MQTPLSRGHQFAAVLMLGALGACGSQKEPAQLQLGEIEGTVSAASADASKYLPDRLQKVQDELNGLREEYQNKDYAAVVSGAPAVLNDAQALAAAASAAQADAVKALTEQWTRLSVSLPAEVTVLSIRIDALGKKSGKRQAAGIDLDAARAALADASSLWSKAQAAFASDNLREAVSTANTVGSKLESLAATLKLDLGTAS